MNAELDRILTDRWSRQRAEEALMEKYRLCDQGCGQQCQEATEMAREMVDTVIEAWRGR